MQLIYGEKTQRSILRYKLPKNLSVIANQPFSNSNKSLKLTDKIIVSHIQSERAKLQLQNDHPALSLIDALLGQMTTAGLHKLHENYILSVRVSSNMTNLFRLLNLTVNRAAKAFMKRRFTEWYNQEIWKEMESGKELNDIGIKPMLNILKSLHSSRVIELYKYFTSQKGAEIIFKA